MDYLKDLESQFKNVEAKLHEGLQSVRSNRPSVEVLENIKVNFYNDWLPLQQMASFAVKPPREIEINVWDKSAVNTVAKAIEDAKVGLSIRIDGNAIKAYLPPLSEERREEMTKLVKKISEAARIQIRSERDEILKKVKIAESAGELTEDQLFKIKEGAQKITDAANKNIESFSEKKTKELAE